MIAQRHRAAFNPADDFNATPSRPGRGAEKKNEAGQTQIAACTLNPHLSTINFQMGALYCGDNLDILRPELEL